MAALAPCLLHGTEQPDSIVVSDAEGWLVEKTVFEETPEGAEARVLYTWDAAARVWSPESRELKASTDSEGAASHTLERQAWNAAARKWRTTETLTTDCDAEGRVTRMLHYEYDNSGKLSAGVLQTYIYSGNDRQESVSKSCLKWDAAANSWLDSLRIKAVIAFDNNGRNTSNITYLWNYDGGKWLLDAREDFEYGADGRVESVYRQQGEDRPKYLFCTYEYEEDLLTQYLYRQEYSNGAWTTCLATTFTAYIPADNYSSEKPGYETASVTQEYDAEGNQLSGSVYSEVYGEYNLLRETVNKSYFQSPTLTVTGQKSLFSYTPREKVAQKDIYTWDNECAEWLFSRKETFFYDEKQTAIAQPSIAPNPKNSITSSLPYNVAGQRVADGYKGVVIRDGKKMLR